MCPSCLKIKSKKLYTSHSKTCKVKPPLRECDICHSAIGTQQHDCFKIDKDYLSELEEVSATLLEEMRQIGERLERLNRQKQTMREDMVQIEQTFTAKKKKGKKCMFHKTIIDSDCVSTQKKGTGKCQVCCQMSKQISKQTLFNA